MQRSVAQTQPWEHSPNAAWPVWVLAGVILAIFASSCGYDFSGWDDRLNFLGNPYLNPPTWQSVWFYCSHFADGLYVPITRLLWLAIGSLAYLNQPDEWGGHLNPWLFHCANLLIHVIAACLVYRLLLRITGKQSAAWLGAMFWAIHPLQVEAVCWPSGMKDLLAGCLGIFALDRYVRQAQRNSLDVIGLIVLALAMLAKPSAMTIPLIGIVLDWLIVGRPIGRAVRAAVPWMLVVIPLAVIARLAQYIPLDNPVAPIWIRPFIFGDALTFYLEKLLMPVRLGVDYGRRWWVLDRSAWFYAEILIPIAIGVVAWLLRRQFAWFAAGVLIFAVAILPVSGLASFEFQFTSTTADHYLYVAMLGPAIIFAFLFQHVRSLKVNALAALILTMMAFQTVRQKAYWENDLTLFLHAIDINPRSGIAHNNLGNAYWTRRDLPDSISEYRKAIAVDEAYSVPYANLKDRLLEANDVNGAIAVMEQYIALRARRTGEDDPGVRKEIEQLRKKSISTTQSSR